MCQDEANIPRIAFGGDFGIIADMKIAETPTSSKKSNPRHFGFEGRQGETLVAVVVGTVVLALAVSGLASILSSNSILEAEYEKNLRIFLLERNTEAILRKIPIKGIGTGQEFYLQKNVDEKRFVILS